MAAMLSLSLEPLWEHGSLGARSVAQNARLPIKGRTPRERRLSITSRHLPGTRGDERVIRTRRDCGVASAYHDAWGVQ